LYGSTLVVGTWLLGVGGGGGKGRGGSYKKGNLGEVALYTEGIEV